MFTVTPRRRLPVTIHSAMVARQQNTVAVDAMRRRLANAQSELRIIRADLAADDEYHAQYHVQAEEVADLLAIPMEPVQRRALEAALTVQIMWERAAKP